MIGIEGSYIKAKRFEAEGRPLTCPREPEFSSNPNAAILLDNSLNTTLVDLVRRITPLCGLYTSLMAFVDFYSQFEYGMTCQALCAAMRELLREYMVLVAQLEDQALQGLLTLQKLWFFVQPALSTLKK